MSIDTLSDRCRVALALGEPMYITEAELRDLKEHLIWNTDPPAGTSRYSWQPNVDRFMGVELVVDFDKAILQGNRYGMTIDQLVSAKAERDAVAGAAMRLINRLWPDP